MKKLILIVVLWITGLGLFAQPVHEKTYTESANICQLESLGEVYYSMDVINKQCHIYRLDHTLYKSIPIPTPEGYYLSDVQYVSEKIFNDDNLVELVYSYTKYVPTETSYFYTYETKLINENGTILLTSPGAGHTNIIETLEDGKKFLVYQYDFSVIPYRTYTHVYSLPESATKSENYFISSLGAGEAYPNPAHRQVTIPVLFPAGVGSGTLELYDLYGQRVLSLPVTESSRNVVLPTHHLVPGTYIYQVDFGHMNSPARKIVIQE